MVLLGPWHSDPTFISAVNHSGLVIWYGSTSNPLSQINHCDVEMFSNLLVRGGEDEEIKNRRR